MDTLAIIKFQSILMTRARLPSPAPMEHSLFGLCNTPASFQRCMMAIFSDLIENIMEVFMDDFLVYGKDFDQCLEILDKVLKRCQETHLVLNWEKCHFMVREGIVLGHRVSERGIEVDRAKIDVIERCHPRQKSRELGVSWAMLASIGGSSRTSPV